MSCANCANQFNSSGGMLPPLSLAAVPGRLGSGPNSRGESALESEALSAVQQLAIAVQNIAVSEILPRTPELIFVNLTTLEGQPYCLELTGKGWRVASLRSDCMQGDFTRVELFTQYYSSLYDLMDDISPGYRDFATNWLNGEKFVHRLTLLQAGNSSGSDISNNSDGREKSYRSSTSPKAVQMPDEQVSFSTMEEIR